MEAFYHSIFLQLEEKNKGKLKLYHTVCCYVKTVIIMIALAYFFMYKKATLRPNKV